jgi:hypothetical protein
MMEPSGRSLELAVYPAHAEALGPAALAWEEAQAQALSVVEGGRASWWVSARADDSQRIALLETEGVRARAHDRPPHAKRAATAAATVLLTAAGGPVRKSTSAADCDTASRASLWGWTRTVAAASRLRPAAT